MTAQRTAKETSETEMATGTDGADRTAAAVRGSVFDRIRTKVSDVSGDTLWPDLPKVELESLIGRRFAIDTYKSITNQRWESAYHILRCMDANGVLFTTATSGGVVGSKLGDMVGKFPVLATAWQQSENVPKGQTGYFDLRDPSDDMPDFIYAAS